MTQLRIEALLRQKIGLDANSIGSSTILRSVRRRMADCGLSDIETYLTRLRTSSEELQELIELVTIPETWFFRDAVYNKNYFRGGNLALLKERRGDIAGAAIVRQRIQRLHQDNLSTEEKIRCLTD